MITETLLQEINKLDSVKEVHEVWDILREHNKRLLGRLGRDFYIGQTVHFLTGKRPTGKVVGTLRKINQKSCQVEEKDSKVKWNVTTSLLIVGEGA